MDVGGRLREAREARGWSIDALARRTRVQPRMLAALETNDIRGIPPKPFGRGFVRAYASEVGLDPDRTVREYFAQFTPPPGPAPDAAPRNLELETTPRSWIWVAAATATAALVFLAWLGGTPDAPEQANAAVVGTTGTPSRALDGRDATDLPHPSIQPRVPAVPSAAADLTVVLTADADCWITATADGERVLYKLLSGGMTETVRADREVAIRAGDAGAVSVTINGRDIGSLGARGAVRTVRITPENAATLR